MKLNQLATLEGFLGCGGNCGSPCSRNGNGAPAQHTLPFFQEPAPGEFVPPEENKKSIVPWLLLAAGAYVALR